MRMQHCGAEFECLQDCERRFATEQSVVLQYRVSSNVSRHACMAGEHRLRPAQT